MDELAVNIITIVETSHRGRARRQLCHNCQGKSQWKQRLPITSPRCLGNCWREPLVDQGHWLALALALLGRDRRQATLQFNGEASPAEELPKYTGRVLRGVCVNR